VFKCARPYSRSTSILQELQHTENHQLLQSIQTNYFTFGKISSEMKKNVIVPSLKESFASDNPFDWKAGTAEGSAIISSTVPFIGKAGTAEGSAIISSPIEVFEKVGADEGSASTVPCIGKTGTAESSAIISSPIEVSEKAGAAEDSPIAAVISPTIGLDVKACEKIIREKLLLLKKKETSQQKYLRRMHLPFLITKTKTWLWLVTN
jgi:hypothetical protein